jgi:cell division septum initiation protein DivIVA
MIDHSLRRPDELLSELVEIVETARARPMSSSVVIPREKVLDLLDAIRESLPMELAEARRVLHHRDGMLAEAHVESNEIRDRAAAHADALIADTQHRSAQVVAEATAHAEQIVADGRSQHAEMVANTAVHQAAASAAAALRHSAEEYAAMTQQDADRYGAQVRAEAERWAASTCGEAEQYAGKLASDAEQYADKTLADVIASLGRAAATAEQGRSALAQRGARRSQPPAPDETDVAPEQQISEAISA